MSWLGSVNGRTAAGGWEVAVTGSGVVVAWNTSGLPLSVGDTVVLEQRQPGVWEVAQRVTAHPEPVVPVKPSVSVTAPATTSFSGEYPAGISYPPGSGSTLAQVIDYLWTLRSDLLPMVGAVTSVKDFADDATAKLNVLRTATTSLTSGVTAVNNYAEGAAEATVSSGQAVKVAGFTVTGVRADNVAGFDSWGHDPSVELEAWLAHRVTWVKEIRAGLNRARLFRGLSAAPTLAADPAVGTTDQPWSVAVTRVQGVDSWFSTASSALVASIGSLRSNLSLPAFNYPTVVVAWSDLGSFEASRVGLALSLMAHHTYYTAGLASAVVEAIRVVNGQ